MSVSKSPYGTWASPITAELLSTKSTSLLELGVHESTGKIYLLEGRPAEEGRCCLVEYHNGLHRDVLPKQYSARTAVHGYGGAAFTVATNGDIVFADWKTKGVFSLSPTLGQVVPIIHNDTSIYYADFDVHPNDNEWILAIQEDHRSAEVENSLVAINASTKKIHSIATGADFYSHPRFSPNGKQICWMQWMHPDMPWTGTLLYVAQWQQGTIVGATLIAGNSNSESISQPRWLPDGTLLFASDRIGFWQLYQLTQGQFEERHIKLPGLMDVEFAAPEWILGSYTYVCLTSEHLVASITKEGKENLISIDLNEGSFVDLHLPIIDIRDNAMRRVSDTSFLVIGSTITSPMALYQVTMQSQPQLELLKASMEMNIPVSLYSTARHISFPRVYGNDRDGESHALYLPPKNPEYDAPAESVPPLIVSLHGGPTSHVSPGLSLSWQYYTSRGYAFASVNYAGSSGYGRAYRNRLLGKWGISDTADVASCVRHLANLGWIDPDRVGVVGGSAGGYTTLQSLCIHPDIWAGGVSQYGISNMKSLAKATHKFESHYLDGLLFKRGASEEDKERVFRERSPLFHADTITAPVLLLQGAEDEVVPPDQAGEMEKVIKGNGGAVRVVLFSGEGHGFRQSENVKRAILEEEFWWKKTLLKSVQ